MSSQPKIKRTPETTEDMEAKFLMNMVQTNIYKDYKNTPHVEESYEEAVAIIEDLVLIQETIARLIKRRNASYIIKKTETNSP
jgi:hypothetical protein